MSIINVMCPLLRLWSRDARSTQFCSQQTHTHTHSGLSIFHEN